VEETITKYSGRLINGIPHGFGMIQTTKIND
jgi:hypothetical protein